MDAEVEWYPGEMHFRVGFIVTNLSRFAEKEACLCNHGGTAKQSLKKSKAAIFTRQLALLEGAKPLE